VLDYKPVVWRNGTIDELVLVAGDASGGALGVNDNGQVVGGSGMCGSGPGIGPIVIHAIMWQNGSITDLGNLGGAVNNIAYAINNRGQIVGASDLPGDSTGHAFLWQRGVMTDLGTLSGDFASLAHAINELGQVVGQSIDQNGNSRAFVWQSGVMTDLNVLIPPGSPLYLLVANDIDSRGEIVGIALDQNSGEPVAFVAVPCGPDTDVHGCNDPVQNAGSIQRLKIVLPDNVRTKLRQRGGFGQPGSGLMKPW
jgi:probable HAF family extracellular repeat protein